MNSSPDRFTCPLCGITSYHPEDIANEYCGNCHLFARDFAMPQGKWLVLRVDGTREPQSGKPTLETVKELIGCTTIDAVVLTKDHRGIPETAMIVDDTGMLDGKRVNLEATKLYVAGHKTGSAIYGDVAIVNDNDF